MSRTHRLWPIGLLLALAAIAWGMGVPQQISWEALARNHVALVTWVALHPVLAAVLYVLIYALATLISLPAATVITVAGGLAFGMVGGGILATMGASAGATVLFLAIRHYRADAGAARNSRVLRRLRSSLARDGFSYLLAIRLVPIFPFWLVNLASALSGIRLAPYAAATVLGVMPVAFIYASIGASLSGVLAEGGQPNLGMILTLPVLGPLLALALLSLLPVALRRWRRAGA